MFQTENVVTCHPANRILNLQNRLWQYQNSSTKSITTAAVSNLSCFWILSGNTQVELHFKTGNFFNRYQFTATLIFHKTTAGSLIMNDIDCWYSRLYFNYKGHPFSECLLFLLMHFPEFWDILFVWCFFSSLSPKLSAT